MTEIAKRAERFLERFGPVDRPDPDRSETDWTDPEQDRQVLIDHLQALRDGPGHQSSVARLAARFRELLTGQYVRAERPEPGKAHVVPLEGAGYAGRRHLLVVGMDADSMEDPRAEDALLLDRDRERVADRAEVLLPLLRDRADESTWTAARALRRHAGTLVLTSRIFDVEAGEEVAPSSIFLRLRRAYGDEEDETPAGLVPPDPDEGLVLDDAEAWLGALRPDRSPADRPDARTIVEETYPWIRFGREASARRHSDVYTEYDGLLPDGPYPELDWLQGEGEAPSVSASRLELLAEAPYLYFLRYVLGVAPLEEPALEDEGWLDRATSGSVIHDALEGFMRDLEGRPPDRTDEDRLLRRLDERIDREKQKRSPPNEAVERAARRRLREDVRAFLRAEIARETPYEARYLELGFGLGPRRTGPGDRVPPVVLSLEEDLVIRLRGRIDRVDAYPDGSVRVWDYKTGSRKRFSESDALQGGRTAQWALYAAAVEELIDGEVDVRTSGYYFSSRRELGARLSFAPREYRAEVARVVRHLSRIARSGSFPMNLDARRWDYEDYDRICPDRDAYSRRLDEKTYPSDRPRPPHLQDD